MLEEDVMCENCSREFTILHYFEDDQVTFCPFCGSDVIPGEPQDFPEDED